MATAEPFHPGEYIADEIEARGWSVETLCERAGFRRDLAEELLACKRPVTSVVAYCLAQAFGTDQRTWLNLQKAFDEHTDEPTKRPTKKATRKGKA